MLLKGEWFVCSDGITRPVIRGESLAHDGSWVAIPFLVDTAADCTAFSANVLDMLGLPTVEPLHRLGGVGGVATSVTVAARIKFPRETGVPVVVSGQYAAFTNPEALDMSVLGRDVLDLFAVIVDRRKSVVCLLCQRHDYVILES
jgi:hypothetical protein